MKGRLALLLTVALLAVAGWWWQDRPVRPRVTTRLLMGTLVEISTWGVTEPVSRRAVGLAFDEMARIEDRMSRMRPDSELARINQAQRGELQPISAELAQVVARGLEMGRLSSGAFDIGLAPLSDLWGFSLEPPPTRPPPPERIADWLAQRARQNGNGIALGGTAENKIRLENAGVGLDLGGIAKGYAVEQAVGILRREGVHDALINAGGDMRILGSKGGKPWHVGLRDPRDPQGVAAILDLLGEVALSTSGDYERYFMADGVRHHHILDPKTGQSARAGLISVSVQAPDAMTADGLSTALFVLGEQAGLEMLRHFPGCEALLIRADGGHFQTPGFIGRWVKGP
ncbi:MAG: FAD:protein FMN transferase [Magnetococcales bacterium]|nr:FAD:protein FMN transferase [Magnetococcales bacterium]